MNVTQKEPTKPGELSLDEQLKALELEERKQALESRKLQDELARLQLNDLRQQHEQKKHNKERGIKDAKEAIEARKAVQNRCNHHVGGKGAAAIVNGQGDLKRETAVGGIKFTDGSILLRCQRCGKPWNSEIPNGDEYHGIWEEGLRLFQDSMFKEIAVVGGRQVARRKVA